MNEFNKKDYEFFKLLKNFNIRDTFTIVNLIRNEWGYVNYVDSRWIFTKDKYVLHFELHTGGLSYNEKIIKSLQQHPLFFKYYHIKWEVGGHYYFEIDPKTIGYYKIQEMCEKLKISRQSINRNSKRFECINYGKKLRNKLYREKWLN